LPVTMAQNDRVGLPSTSDDDPPFKGLRDLLPLVVLMPHVCASCRPNGSSSWRKRPTQMAPTYLVVCAGLHPVMSASVREILLAHVPDRMKSYGRLEQRQPGAADGLEPRQLSSAMLSRTCGLSAFEGTAVGARRAPRRHSRPEAEVTAYSITSSAIASNEFGTIRPSALAILGIVQMAALTACRAAWSSAPWPAARRSRGGNSGSIGPPTSDRPRGASVSQRFRMKSTSTAAASLASLP
jgi:hypothetical protein